MLNIIRTVSKLCLIAILFENAKAQPKTDIIMTDVYSIIHDPDIVGRQDLQVIPYQGRNVVNGSFMYLRRMTKLEMQFIVDFEFPNKKCIRLLNVNFDGCKFFNGLYGNQKLAQLIMRKLANQKGFPKKCPLVANHTYTIEYYSADPQNLPLPNSKFHATIIGYSDGRRRRTTMELHAKGFIKQVK